MRFEIAAQRPISGSWDEGGVYILSPNGESAPDGCTLKATVADKDGHPVPDSHVPILPASANTEVSLAAAFLSGRTDRNGAYTSAVLAPGTSFPLTLVPRTLD